MYIILYCILCTKQLLCAGRGDVAQGVVGSNPKAFFNIFLIYFRESFFENFKNPFFPRHYLVHTIRLTPNIIALQTLLFERVEFAIQLASNFNAKTGDKARRYVPITISLPMV